MVVLPLVPVTPLHSYCTHSFCPDGVQCFRSLVYDGCCSGFGSLVDVVVAVAVEAWNSNEQTSWPAKS